MSITLKTIDAANWQNIIQLSVRADQKSFVASNSFSLLQSHYESDKVPLAVYLGEEAIGFMMYGKDPEDGKYWIVRFMIDHRHQGKGYGRTALLEAIHWIRGLSDCSPTITISYKPDNLIAEALYESVGFKKTGEMTSDHPDKWEVISELYVK
ncbi:GNAT family N-acetyltransferase [Paenibacillus sp. NPDC056579]|uniref:GNAT family N-acetyltransferase n=1 Tax=unclassified Paenibacillus TaxID=185978 RepID=UPI001EF94638|nr:GNAT family N-acetyltransferase [Paenibacillus sp. H1-7]ULL17786.1 GNAT family N-acetyltransferase [Paenibacillus sp. H1-7]